MSLLGAINYLHLRLLPQFDKRIISYGVNEKQLVLQLFREQLQNNQECLISTLKKFISNRMQSIENNLDQWQQILVERLLEQRVHI